MICTRKPHKNSHRRTKATPDPNTSTASSEQEHSTGALPPPFSALLILPAFTNSASALLGRRSGAATAVAAPACTIYGATQRGRVRHKQTAASRRRQKQSQKRLSREPGKTARGLMSKEIRPPDGPCPTSTSWARTLRLSQRRRALRRRNERACFPGTIL